MHTQTQPHTVPQSVRDTVHKHIHMQPVNLYAVYFVEADTQECNFDHVLATNQTEAREIFLKNNEENELYNVDHIQGAYQVTGVYYYQDKGYNVSAQSLTQ